MEKDYDSKRESKIIKRLSRITISTAVAGGMIAIGGFTYSTINRPFQPTNLERYEEINLKLDGRPNLTLGDLEFKSAEFIARANKLKTERDEIISDPNFAEVRRRYESEKQNTESIRYFSSLGGSGIISLCLIPLFLAGRKVYKKMSIFRGTL